jgi:long-chain acyl-CoA synthetase
MAILTTKFAAERGDEAALIDEHGSTTFRQLDARVNRLVNGLRAAGLSRGDTLAVIVGNRAEWFEIAMACAHGGWTYVPVNWHWVADELAYVLEDAQVVGVLSEDRYAEQVDVALADPRAAGVRLDVRIGDGGTYEDFLAGASDAEPDDQRLGGPMFYTSGTTGRPKGVRGSLLGSAELTPDVLQLVSAGFAGFLPVPGRTLLCGPVYHSAQWAFSFLPLVAGSAVVMQHKYDAAGALTLIDRHGVTNVHLVPTQMKRLVDLPEDVKAAFDGSSLALAIHGAAPCPPAVKRAMIDWWGPKITEYYGSTEGSIVSMITSAEWLAKGGSVGKPLDSVEVTIVGDDGSPCPTGAEGTIYFRNRLGMEFSYHNDPDKTAAAHVAPGVATTGDVGFLDDDGYLWLSDRRIDMIISGGVNIYPAEIEGVLQGHPDVADAAVIGVPSEEYGEDVKAIVQPAEGVEPSDELAARLVAHCRTLLAGYKAPKSVDFVTELPRSGAGKLQKRQLREPYWAGRERRI